MATERPTRADVWAVKLFVPGASPELVYVVAPDEGEADRQAWRKLETITGRVCGSNRWSLVSLVIGVRDRIETTRRRRNAPSHGQP